jgi:starch-binding outer membrane protein, SusD/RagB family
MKKALVFGKAMLLGGLLACTTQSCNESYLKETTYDVLTPDKFFKTDDEFIAALGSAYTSLYGYGNHNNYNSFQEMTSDEIMIPQRGGDWYDGGFMLRAHRHETIPTDDGINNTWTFCYGGISTCNRLIYQFSKLVSDGKVDGTKAGGFIAELKTLRALYYSWLLDVFGNIPIVDKFDVPADFKPATASRADVFKFVETELTTNVPLLSKTVGGPAYGRMNFYTGQAMLAKLYLNAGVYTGTAQWDKCIAACDEVTKGGYKLESNFFANFSANNGGSAENIFVVPYDHIFAQGFNLVQMTLHYGSQETYNLQAQPWNGYCSLQEFYESFDKADARKKSFLAGPQYRPDGKQVQDAAFDKTDPDGAGLNFTPEINEHFPGTLRQAGVRVGKFEFVSGGTPNMDNDFPLFRYSQVVLAKAEALWRKNAADPAALALVNTVRTRAGMPAFTALTATDLLAELGREFFYEGLRRQNLIRFGKFDKASKWQTASFGKEKEIAPIPAAQIKANSNLKQNPGY